MVVDKHALIRTNHGPVMPKGLSKTITKSSKFRNRYERWPSRENFVAFRKQKYFCNNLNEKIKRNYFTKIASTRNKGFWNAVKPFLTSKGFLHNDDIATEFDNRTITDEKEFSKTFNEYYINIV